MHEANERWNVFSFSCWCQCLPYYHYLLLLWWIFSSAHCPLGARFFGPEFTICPRSCTLTHIVRRILTVYGAAYTFQLYYYYYVLRLSTLTLMRLSTFRSIKISIEIIHINHFHCASHLPLVVSDVCVCTDSSIELWNQINLCLFFFSVARRLRRHSRHSHSLNVVRCHRRLATTTDDGGISTCNPAPYSLFPYRLWLCLICLSCWCRRVNSGVPRSIVLARFRSVSFDPYAHCLLSGITLLGAQLILFKLSFITPNIIVNCAVILFVYLNRRSITKATVVQKSKASEQTEMMWSFTRIYVSMHIIPLYLRTRRKYKIRCGVKLWTSRRRPVWQTVYHIVSSPSHIAWREEEADDDDEDEMRRSKLYY